MQFFEQLYGPICKTTCSEHLVYPSKTYILKVHHKQLRREEEAALADEKLQGRLEMLQEQFEGEVWQRWESNQSKADEAQVSASTVSVSPRDRCK